MPAFTLGSQTKELLKQLLTKAVSLSLHLTIITVKQHLMLTERLLRVCTILIIYTYQLILSLQ